MQREVKIITALIVSFFIARFLTQTVFLQSPSLNPSFLASIPASFSRLADALTGKGEGTEETQTDTVQGQQTGAIIFSWYYCPPDDKTCIPDRWKYHPPGSSEPYPNDGGTYSPNNYMWWKIEATDMTCSGLDTAFVYIWDKDAQYFNHVGLFVQAVQDINSPLKIAEYWDASYASGDGGPVDLSDPQTALYRYQNFVKPFYQKVPKEKWAMQNGRPILAVYRYGTDKYTNDSHANEFFQSIKDQFQTDFGVEPFLILGHVWTWGTSTAAEAADGINEAFPSATCAGGNARIQQLNGFTSTTIAAGAWDDNNQGGCHLDRNDDAVLKLGFSQIPPDNNLLMIESWNELGEGSGMERATDYPKTGGGTLPDTYYMDTLRELLGKNDRGMCKTVDEITGGGGAKPTNTPAPQNTKPPGQNPTPTKPPTGGGGGNDNTTAGSVEIKIHINTEDGTLFDEGNASVYLEGPSSNGHRFGETLSISNENGTCTSNGGFPYSCSAGTAIWKGADNTSGTAPGAYSATITKLPTGWTTVEGQTSGTLSAGGKLTLNLIVTKK